MDRACMIIIHIYALQDVDHKFYKRSNHANDLILLKKKNIYLQTLTFVN